MPLCALGNLSPRTEGQRYWLAPNAYVIGDVVLGEDVSVWFAATIRGDNETIHVGANSNIQDGAVLHSDPGSPLSIGSGVTVGHGAIVHGCSIEDNCLIGMGATILNGAVIGEGSVVAANALVAEGKVFPPNSLIVGAPARALRSLTEQQTATLKNAARVYVANGQRYAAEFQVLPDPSQ